MTRRVAIVSGCRTPFARAGTAYRELTAVDLGKNGTLDVRFRTDLVTVRDGVIVITDIKTGKPLTEGKKEDTRVRHLLGRIRDGTRLQAAAYASFRVPAGASAEGRYLFVKPEIPPQSVTAALSGTDQEMQSGFAESVRLLHAGQQQGLFFPRLENPKGKEPTFCQWCDVVDACGRQETSVRQRLAGVATRARQRQAEGRKTGSWESQLARLWFQGEEPQ